MSTFTVDPRGEEFLSAVASVKKEFLLSGTKKFSSEKARLIINEVYKMRGGETGQAFRNLVEKAVRKYSFISYEHRWYLLIAMRYFNKRSVAKKKRKSQRNVV